MQVMVVNAISLSGVDIEPGAIFDCPKDSLDHLLNSRAIVPIGAPEKKVEMSVEAISPSDPVDELTKIKVVDKKIAKCLVNAGFDTIEKVAECSLEVLSSVKGINKKIAEQIYNSFSDLTYEDV